MSEPYPWTDDDESWWQAQDNDERWLAEHTPETEKEPDHERLELSEL